MDSTIECVTRYLYTPRPISFIDLTPISRSGIDQQSSFAHKSSLSVLLGIAAEKFEECSDEYRFYLGDFYPTVKKLLSFSTVNPRFPAEEWAETLFRFVSRFSEKGVDILQRFKEQCGELLAQIFIWRAATFWLEAENLNEKEVESKIMLQADSLREKFISRNTQYEK